MKMIDANGAKIPALGFGTWQLEGDACSQIVSSALQAGYKHVDTAIYYKNESAVGEGLRISGVDRGDYFLTTKVWPTEMSEGVFQREVEASLQRLGVDNVDLLLVHWPPQTGEVSQWARLMNEAVEKGWTKHIGVSNFTVPLLNEMVEKSDRLIVCNQVENHPYIDQSRVRAACRQHGVALIAYCPLFRGGEMFEEQAVIDAGEEHGKSSAQIVLRWHVQHDGGGAIPKTATLSRLPENLDIFDFELSADEMASIDQLMGRQSRICDFEFSPKWDAV